MGWPGPLTHKQYLAWQAWLEIQWNRPDRGDYYIMLLAAMWGEKGSTIDQFRIKFRDPGEAAVTTTADQTPEIPGMRVPRRLTKETLPAAKAALAKVGWTWALGSNRPTPQQPRRTSSESSPPPTPRPAPPTPKRRRPQ